MKVCLRCGREVAPTRVEWWADREGRFCACRHAVTGEQGDDDARFRRMEYRIAIMEVAREVTGV